MDLAKHGNLLEAGLWVLVAIVLLVRMRLSDRRFRRAFGLLAATFLVFGISDVIEARTGAWWRPFWLLLLKGACLLFIVLGFRQYFRIKKSL